tara:strand:+ start:1859 stop:2704 length:846 start_codon:yes stop_codon:yes gene_type:complete
MKDLAVLIPSYNDTSSLVETLSSIDEQDNSFTVVVVDDGSVEPVQIDTSNYGFGIEVIRLDKNAGIVSALNAGLEYISSKGFDYTARLDAADLNRPNRFATQYEFLRTNQNIAMVGSNVVFRDETSREPIFTTNLPTTPRETNRWIDFRNCFIHPSVMFRNSVLDKTGVYDDRFPHIEDYVLFSRIVGVADTANLETPLVDCFVRQNGISLKNEKAQLLSGLKFKLTRPQPFRLLWYAFIAKRLSYLVIPLKVRTKAKLWLGFASSAPRQLSEATPVTPHL